MDIELEFSDDDEGSVSAMEFEDSQTRPTSSFESTTLDEYLAFDDDGGYSCLDIAHVLESALVEEEEEEADSNVDMDEDAEAEGSDTEQCEALDLIEDMVVNFLTQVTTAYTRSSSRSDSDGSEVGEDSRKKGGIKKRPKVEVQLADRRKLDKNGWVYGSVLLYLVVSDTQLFSVLDIAHEALTANMPTTKRDVYYKDVKLFKTQKTVDQVDFGQRAASKGLLCGSGLTIHLFSGETIAGKDTDGVNIPVGEDIESFGVDEDVRWVLVVEKEAVFQTLCRLGVANHACMPGRGIVITGKGYPDVATRHLVKSLADALPKRIPIAALVDCDPYGLDILSVYRYGSKGMQHENELLAARRIRWLGLRTSELSELGIDWDDLLPITRNDEKKILSMLHRPHLPSKWKQELMRTLHLRRKAEIEIISTATSESGNRLLSYLSSRIAKLVGIMGP
ncbi:hypothetical protein EST38_g2345 [Candolleomyces aberdarensis]|uniref:DNA topoisomerase (ATP-hydrolyzing) n=1 Tax=Candolleomyces aberdarensis TaxID=2316362 RepID=A0A4Q2DW85_9AGAR|nr:hypothetical protein EST38_g2345 [Candolleomyces aberdarensis]